MSLNLVLYKALDARIKQAEAEEAVDPNGNQTRCLKEAWLVKSLRDTRDLVLKELSDDERSEVEIEKADKPSPVDEPDWDAIVKIAESIISDVACNNCEESDEDNKQYMFETVMETIYGKEIWVWWNRKVA